MAHRNAQNTCVEISLSTDNRRFEIIWEAIKEDGWQLSGDRILLPLPVGEIMKDLRGLDIPMWNPPGRLAYRPPLGYDALSAVWCHKGTRDILRREREPEKERGSKAIRESSKGALIPEPVKALSPEGRSTLAPSAIGIDFSGVLLRRRVRNSQPVRISTHGSRSHHSLQTENMKYGSP